MESTSHESVCRDCEIAYEGSENAVEVISLELACRDRESV
jgi:hypothetical protein